MKKKQKSHSQQMVEFGAYLHGKNAPRPKVEKNKKREHKKWGGKKRGKYEE
jgi:hypothetical protein